MTEAVPAHPFLLRLAGRLLAKAERATASGPVRLKLDRREAPELYGQTDADHVQRWVMLLQAWCDQGGVSLVLAKPREFASFIDRKPQLQLDDFHRVATWAGYEPLAQRWQKQWQVHLQARWLSQPLLAPPNPVGLLAYLARNPLLAVQELSLDEAAHSLEVLQALCATGQPLPLREASALAFQGRSKVLDNREELLRLLGAELGQFQEAPIQLLVAIVPDFDDVLFIENLLTFERMADHRQPDWQRSLLVYAAGFKGSAKRLRSRLGCQVYLRAGAQLSHPQGLAAVHDWLFGAAEWPVYFFGDLDYSGLHILASLREVFGAAGAWPTGYRFLARVIEQGGGHAPHWAGKEQQQDPVTTGCAYADLQLLPLLRARGRFVDQELFSPVAQPPQPPGNTHSSAPVITT